MDDPSDAHEDAAAALQSPPSTSNLNPQGAGNLPVWQFRMVRQHPPHVSLLLRHRPLLRQHQRAQHLLQRLAGPRPVPSCEPWL